MAWVPQVAEAYLTGLTAANRQIMGYASLPPLYSTKVAWSLGDVGTLPLAHTVLRRGRAACGPLAAYRAAELQRHGENARAVVVPSPSGIAGRWHAVVRRGNGSIEDPSRILRRKQMLGQVLGFGWKRALTAAATGGQSEMERAGIGPSAGAEHAGFGQYSGDIKKAFGRLPGGAGRLPRGAGAGAPGGGGGAPYQPSAPTASPVSRASAAHLRLPMGPGSAATIDIPLALVGDHRMLRLSGPMPDILGAAGRVVRGPLRSLIAPRTRLALSAANAAAQSRQPRAVAGLLARAGYSDLARQVAGVVR
mgnify:CR=1 FL=1